MLRPNFLAKNEETGPCKGGNEDVEAEAGISGCLRLSASRTPKHRQSIGTLPSAVNIRLTMAIFRSLRQIPGLLKGVQTGLCYSIAGSLM
jgi:hypothetical protein